MFKKVKNSSGFLLIEVIIAIALVGVIFVTLSGIQFFVLKMSKSIEKETRADFLVKEEFEALRNYRDGTTWDSEITPIGLGKVSVGSNSYYYLENSSGSWNLVKDDSSPYGENIDGIFTRYVVFDKVCRDGSNNIIVGACGGDGDTDTRKVTVTVEWEDKKMEVVSYLTNWRNE